MATESVVRVVGARVVPCEDRSVIENGTMIVHNDRIEWLGPSAAVPAKYAVEASPSSKIIDGTGLTLIPGLVDAHMHISFGEAASEEELSIHTPVAYRAIRAAVNAKRGPRRRRDQRVRSWRAAGHRRCGA